MTGFGQLKNPFQTLQFDKVVLYDFESKTEKWPKTIVDSSGKYLHDIVKQVELKTKVIKELTTKLGQKGPASASLY